MSHTKEQTKHTPGPWLTDPGSISYIVDEKEEKGIAEVYHNSNDEPVNGMKMPSMREGKANAQLIASAPDLLEACKAAQELTDKWLRTEHGADFFEIDNILRSSINKAEGNS